MPHGNLEGDFLLSGLSTLHHGLPYIFLALLKEFHSPGWDASSTRAGDADRVELE
jgi:hypothetical protein